ncbi:gliding motility-associated C-terminal domain-containing protein [Pedobacter sp. SD-b]|uniref:Gliding motility-associated C-terminal domain-containing protein n=1 Tax=Pedobacter segetis TaxID=2793069 RepID=A0ABS1BKS6_9SPHI|nr:PKD domain-containing protein [Pedobacter segetis]MBK0383495.1 gliding motility-associated C-terminal domain-containing protein [Pedobacter segetis]
MKLLLKVILITVGFISLKSIVKAQNISNEGNLFWVCFADHVPANNSLATMSVFVTSKNNSSGVVSCGSFTQRFTVAANKVTEVLVPRSVSFIGTGTGISPNKGIKIETDQGQPDIVVYAHVFAGARSAATLVLPYQALGQKHFAMSYDQKIPANASAYSQLNVVAVDANTTFNVTPVIDGVKQSKFSITLQNIGDVYQYQNVKDVTGTVIEVDSVTSGCKRIAAFSGSSAVAIGTSTCNPLQGNVSLDPLFQQLYPIDSWGYTYPLIPFYNRNTGSIYRVIATEDGTVVNIDGLTINLNAGDFYSSPAIDSVSLIKANKRISVAQFALSQQCSDSRNSVNNTDEVGDPDMVILNPLEYSIDKITLYSSTKLAISEQYINVIIPTAKVSSFKINNLDFSGSFSPVPKFADYSYAQIYLNALGGNNFSLSADTGFNATAYGFGPVESYAYSAGTSLASTTTVNALKSSTNQIVKIACVNEAFDFRLLLPYIPTKLVWNLDDTSAPFIQNNPTYNKVTQNNKILYEFKLPAKKTFTTSGNKLIKITASLPTNTNVCSTTDEEIVNFNLEVSDLPVAEFSSKDKVCVTFPLQFNYVEKNVGEPVTKWLWDFGDGTTSTLKDPSHSFNKIGNYKVKLSLQSKIDCASNVFEKSISVIDPLTPAFETQNPLCVNSSIKFADLTQSTDGFSSWTWDFGDGTGSNLQSPNHTFTKSGNYNVKLTVVSITGCKSFINKIIKISDLAEIDFLDPGSCINDLVSFEGIITKGNVVSWLWDYGDGSNDVVEKVKQKTQHRYLSTGIYNVKLQAVSAEGCTTTLTKSITVSGSNPKVAFDVLNKDNLCSNTPVSFKNNSSIVFGNIVKLEIIYQYSTTGNQIVFTDNHPVSGKIYNHQYPASSVDKNYQVVFKAYSGNSCYQESAPLTITVHGSPLVVFDDIPPVCLNAPKFLLSAAKETTGIAGTAKLEGEGVVGGFFDPAVAGVGNHLITYTFTSNKGCQDQVSKIITVSDIPVVDAGQDLDILLSGEKQIDAKATGNGLKYKWIPSVGLSNDSIVNPIASPKETTKYTLTVTSKEGCVVADQVTVTVHIDPYIPNVFSPNGDGINDTWVIKYLETFVNASIKIFNRYGQIVFSAKQYNTPWDGKFNNTDMPVGVYYYIIEPNNGRNRYTGSITLLR